MIARDIDCDTCVNQNCVIKKNLSSALVREYAEKKSVIKCKKSQQFVMEGAHVNGLFFIYEGSAKVFRSGINAREQIVKLARAGEVVGHRGLGEQTRHYHISAMSMEPSILCYFSKEILQEMMLKEAKLTYSFMLFYASELNRSEERMKSIAHMSVRERVADGLLYVHRKFGQDREGILTYSLTRREYADYAGTTEEQVIRVLSALKKEGMIVTKGRKIGIKNMDMLKKEISPEHYFLSS